MLLIYYIFLILPYFINCKVCPQQNLCIDISANGEDAVFTLTGDGDVGYMAVGLGTQMEGSEIFVTWFDKNKRPRASYNKGTGHRPPNRIDSQDLKISSASTLSSSEQVITFTRKLKSSVSGGIDINLGTDNNIIWAYSKNKPGDDGTIVRHDNRGTLKYKVTAEKSTPNNSSDQEKETGDKTTPTLTPDSPNTDPDTMSTPTSIIAHAVLMMLAWLILPAIAIFIARYLKNHLGPWWFRLHWGLFLSTGIIAIIAIVIIALDVGNVLDNPHAIMGLIIMSLFIMQIILGVYIDQQWDPSRMFPPVHDKIHWWLGRFIFLLAIGTMIYGMTLTPTPLYFVIPFAIILATIIGAFTFYQLRMGVPKHDGIPLNSY